MSRSEEFSRGGLTRYDIPAAEVQEGDRLDRSGKTRVSKRHPRTDKVMVQTQTRGTRSPSVQQWGNDDQVAVYRK